MRHWLVAVVITAATFLAGFGLGWWHCAANQAVTQTRADLRASETLRTEEHADAVEQITALDQLATAQLVRAPRVLAARDDLVRVQRAALAIEAATAIGPAGQACGVDPRLAGLAELLREGASLVEEGSRHVEQLRDQRDAFAGPSPH